MECKRCHQPFQEGESILLVMPLRQLVLLHVHRRCEVLGDTPVGVAGKTRNGGWVMSAEARVRPLGAEPHRAFWEWDPVPPSSLTSAPPQPLQPSPCERCREPFIEGDTGKFVREHAKQVAPTRVHEKCLRENDQPWIVDYQPFTPRHRR